MLKEINHRIERTVLVIGRTAAFRQPRSWVLRNVCFQHLYQVRFTNPGLSTEENHLTFSFLNQIPAFSQLRQFQFSAHHWGQAGRCSHIEAGTSSTFAQYPVDLNRLRNPFKGLCAQRLAGKERFG